MKIILISNKFIENIVERNNILPKIKSKLMQSKLPILFYGAGTYASELYKLMSHNGIIIDAVFVDDIYLPKDFSSFNNFKIYSFSQIFQEYDYSNVIVAFSASPDIIKERLLKTGKVDSVIFYDCAIGGSISGDQDLIDYQYVYDNISEFNKVYNMFADEKSKNTMTAFLNQRISGNNKYLNSLYCSNQYFPEDIIHLKENEIFVDCGAYDGDTINNLIEQFKISNSLYKSIYAFEPDKDNFIKLERLKKTIQNLICINKGVWNEKTSLHFEGGRKTESFVSEAGTTGIETDAIDNIFKEIAAPTFIKMDIEGSELMALKGAEKTIIRYKPKLAICVYHKKEDLIEIPAYLKLIQPSYRFYLRSHQYYSFDLVLYAI